MNRALISVDIIVNAAGATMILFFLFIVRVSPEKLPDVAKDSPPPIELVRSVMILNIMGPIDELYVLLCRVSGGGVCFRIEAGGPASSQVTQTIGDPEFLPLRVAQDALRVVVACAGPDSEWVLRLGYGVFGRGDLDESSPEVVVRMELEDRAVAALNVEEPWQRHDTNSATHRAWIDPRRDRVLPWSIANGGGCG